VGPRDYRASCGLAAPAPGTPPPGPPGAGLRPPDFFILPDRPWCRPPGQPHLPL